MFKTILKSRVALSILLATTTAANAEEISYFKNFVQPDNYVAETHYNIANNFSRPLRSSADRPMWQHVDLKHSNKFEEEWKSVKWYGILVRDFGINGHEKAIADRSKNYADYLKMNFQVVLRKQAPHTFIGSNPSQISDVIATGIHNDYSFVGKPAAKVVREWVFPVPQDYNVTDEVHENTTLVRSNKPGDFFWPTTRVYLMEFSANVPVTKLKKGNYFLTINPLIGKDEFSEGRTYWHWVVNDIKEAEATPRETDNNANHYSAELKNAMRMLNGIPHAALSRGFTASMGLFDDELTNIPTLKAHSLSELDYKARAGSAADAELKEENKQLTTRNADLSTQLSSVNNQLTARTNQVNLLTNQVNKANTLSEQLTQQKQQLTQQKQQLEQRNNSLNAEKNTLQANLNNANNRIAEITGFQENNVFRIRGHASGKCLDVAHFRLANNTNVLSYQCHGGNNQKWVFNPTTGQIKTKLGNQCLDIGGNHNSGANLKTWECLPYGHPHMKNQSFILNGHLIHSKANPRIAFDSIGNHNSANVIMHHVHGNANQRWDRIK
ncbi:RICIN domain-containing protein [Parashewanella tropica]|uniref:RICIN domain-containing protein n=1 Tax=Parashewanella tropica TaxID=2547970 RepID=UPI001479649D|nr:RICIN domain-containing protein [Parashewanella tropica]